MFLHGDAYEEGDRCYPQLARLNAILVDNGYKPIEIFTGLQRYHVTAPHWDVHQKVSEEYFGSWNI